MGVSAWFSGRRLWFRPVLRAGVCSFLCRNKNEYIKLLSVKIDKNTYNRNVQRLGDHEIIFREGEPGKHMFVILDGVKRRPEP